MRWRSRMNVLRQGAAPLTGRSEPCEMRVPELICTTPSRRLVQFQRPSRFQRLGRFALWRVWMSLATVITSNPFHACPARP